MLSMHIIIMHLATLPYRSILLCLGMQYFAQDYKRALLLAELCSDGRPILHKLGATHPMFKGLGKAKCLKKNGSKTSCS